jgi:hypothetical protein
MLKRLYSITLGGALALSPLALPAQNTEHSLNYVSNVTLDITSQGDSIDIATSGALETQQLTISRGGKSLEPSQDGTYHDQKSSSPDAFYLVQLVTPMETANDPVAKPSPPSDAPVPSSLNLTIATVPVPVVTSTGDSALAATVLPTRTRFRYQTFIPDASVDAPAPACAPMNDSNGSPVGTFLGDNRSWNADSTHYRTRQDVLIDWSAGGTLEATASVGQSTRTLEYFGFGYSDTLTDVRTAASDGLTVLQGMQSPTYVSFHMYGDATNPFCSPNLTRSIWYSLAYFVSQSGNYTVTGTIRQVPNHELYARDNVNPTWRMLLQNASKGFLCLSRGWPDCTIDISPLTGDLVP